MHHLFFYAQRTIGWADRDRWPGCAVPAEAHRSPSATSDPRSCPGAAGIGARSDIFPPPPTRPHPPLGRPAGGASRLEHERRLQPRAWLRAGRRVHRPRCRGGQHRRSNARRPRARARHRSGLAAVGQSPQPALGARAAALPGITDDHPRAPRRRYRTRMPPAGDLSGRGWSRRSCPRTESDGS